MPEDDLEVTCDMPAIKPRAVEMDPAASAEWDRIIAALPPQLFNAADISVLTIYVTSWSLFWKAQDEIDEYGVLIKETTTKETQDGDIITTEKYKANPAVAVWKTAIDGLLKTGDRLGLNPGVRARMQLPSRNQKPKSKFEGLLPTR